MAIEDIDNLPASVADGASGHVADTNKIIGGLKALKGLVLLNYTKPGGGIPTADIADNAITNVKVAAGTLAPNKVAGTAVITTDARLATGQKALDTVPLSQYISLVEPQIYPGVTFTVGTDAPAWTINAYVAPTTQGTRFRVVGPPLISDGQGNASYWASWNASNNGSNVVSHEQTFFLKGPAVSGMFYSYGDMDVQFMVDGKLVKPSFTVLPNVANFYFFTLNFTDDTSLNKIREVRVFLGQLGLYQWLLPVGGSMIASNTNRYTIGIAAADSYWHGAGGTSEGSISGGTLAACLSIFTGGKVEVIAAGAMGGTGYQNAGYGTLVTPGPQGQTAFGAQNRRDKFATWASMCDCVVVAGGANDGEDSVYSVATTVAAANTAWTNYAALASGKPLIVIGIESGVFPGIAAKLNTLNTALKNAANAHGSVTAYVDDRAANIISGTGRIDSPVGDGNADFMVCSDGVHPSRFGNEQITRQRIVLMGSILVPRI